MNTIGNNAPPSSVLLSSQADIAAEFGGDQEAQLAALVLQMASQRKQDSGRSRLELEERMRVSEERQVRMMRAEASELRDAAAKEFVCGVAGSALQTAAAFSGDTNAAKVLGGAANTTGASAKLVGQGDRYQAAQRQADAKQSEQRADGAGRSLERLSEESADADQLEDKALDFLQETRRIRAETELAYTVRG